MSETIQEVTLVLQHEGQEIERIAKTFGMVENEEEDQIPAKTIDETINEILNEIQQVANNVGLEISKEELAQITMLLIISIVRPTGLQEIVINLQKPTKKEDIDTESEDATTDADGKVDENGI